MTDSRTRHGATLSRKLTRMNMLVSGTALVLACIALAAYDFMTFRDLLLRQLSIQAQVAASNSRAALTFDDPSAAERTLQSLQASPDVISAQIYRADGGLFASYRRDTPDSTLPSLVLPDGHIETHTVSVGSMALARRIIDDGMPIGTIYIHATLQALYARLGRYLLIAAFVLLTSLLAALLVSRLAQRAISAPLVALAGVARHVADSETYAVRAVADTGAPYEVARVTEAFNQMMARIQSRDLSLRQAHDELDARVRQRTSELDATNQELEAFSYSVSHDLRAPLRHVAGFATLLQQHAGGSLDERGRGYLTTITEAAGRMGQLIDDLLAFSRTGRASLVPRDVDLGRLVQDARTEIAPEADGREIEWTVHDLPTVRADPALLRPVMVNLLSNAVKYSAPRSVARIEVGARAADGETVVFVKDNGVGFDMQYAHKLFGVFQRLHRADEFSGTGIGLANVRRIVARHGGRTWADSEPDRGATFYFSLPDPVAARAQP